MVKETMMTLVKSGEQTMGGSDSSTQTTQPLVTTPTANKQK